MKDPIKLKWVSDYLKATDGEKANMVYHLAMEQSVEKPDEDDTVEMITWEQLENLLEKLEYAFKYNKSNHKPKVIERHEKEIDLIWKLEMLISKVDDTINDKGIREKFYNFPTTDDSVEVCEHTNGFNEQMEGYFCNDCGWMKPNAPQKKTKTIGQMDIDEVWELAIKELNDCDTNGWSSFRDGIFYCTSELSKRLGKEITVEDIRARIGTSPVDMAEDSYAVSVQKDLLTEVDSGVNNAEVR